MNKSIITQLQKLFPDLPTLFLENLLTKVLNDPSWVNKAFDKHQNSNPMPDSDPGYYATLMTLNEILAYGEAKYSTTGDSDEPDEVIITIKCDYGS